MEHAFHRHHHIEYRTCWAAHVNQDRTTGSRIPFAQRIGKTMRPPPLRDLFRVSPCLPYQSSRCVEDAGDDEIGFAGGHFWQVVREALQGLFSALDGAVLLDDKVTIGWRVKDPAYSQPCLFAQVFESPYSHEVRAGPAFLSSSVRIHDTFRLDDFFEHAAVGIVGAVRAVLDVLPYAAYSHVHLLDSGRK